MNLKQLRKVRDKVCKGCTTYEFSLKWGSPCNIPHKVSGHVCPCSKCLVKMVCTEVCDVVENYKRINIKNINKKKTRKMMVQGDTHISDSKNSYFTYWDKRRQFYEKLSLQGDSVNE